MVDTMRKANALLAVILSADVEEDVAADAVVDGSKDMAMNAFRDGEYYFGCI